MIATEKYKIDLALLIIISFFLHIIILLALLMPDYRGLVSYSSDAKSRSVAAGRDIIVNINQDDKRIIDNRTLLSDRDSSARGYITREKGDRWLNNSLEFKLKKGATGSEAGERVVSQGREKFILNDLSEVVMNISRPWEKSRSSAGSGGAAHQVTIPDKNSVTRQNAIYYSNDGMFSFNTAKFKNFEYFRQMKNKIASNWHPPAMANAIIRGYNPVTGAYAPGSMRIMAIQSQQVKLYFIMDRNGDVLEVKILDSLGNKSLDSSCLDAIRYSNNFGPVPENIKGEQVLIPFIFGYYSR
ncbi:MAG: energy transducer TonB [Spirochaetota bacterium]